MLPGVANLATSKEAVSVSAQNSLNKSERQFCPVCSSKARLEKTPVCMVWDAVSLHCKHDRHVHLEAQQKAQHEEVSDPAAVAAAGG